VLALNGVLRIQVDARGWRTAAGVLTAADVPHSLDGRGTEVLLVFSDPEAEVGAALLSRLGGAARLFSSTERDSLTRNADPMSLMGPGGVAWTGRVLELLGGEAPPARLMHPQVRKVLRLLSEQPVGTDHSLAALARRTQLSPGRLMHAFTESVGIPLRPYLAWLRLQRAAGAIVSGMALSQAALSAGFSDAAHMGRTFRRMFGAPPSSLRPPTR
jgi:AraC-like DNA-binding protein